MSNIKIKRLDEICDYISKTIEQEKAIMQKDLLEIILPYIKTNIDFNIGRESIKKILDDYSGHKWIYTINSNKKAFIPLGIDFNNYMLVQRFFKNNPDQRIIALIILNRMFTGTTSIKKYRVIKTYARNLNKFIKGFYFTTDVIDKILFDEFFVFMTRNGRDEYDFIPESKYLEDPTVSEEELASIKKDIKEYFALDMKIKLDGIEVFRPDFYKKIYIDNGL